LAFRESKKGGGTEKIYLANYCNIKASARKRERTVPQWVKSPTQDKDKRGSEKVRWDFFLYEKGGGGESVVF